MIINKTLTMDAAGWEHMRALKVKNVDFLRFWGWGA